MPKFTKEDVQAIISEVGLEDCSFEKCVVFAVDHNIDDGRLRIREKPQEEQGHQKGMLEHGSGLGD